MNYNFSMLNERYLGNGNPKGSLWLISGFEEAGDWKNRQMIEDFFAKKDSVYGFYPFERGQVPVLAKTGV